MTEQEQPDGTVDTTGIKGTVIAELFGPDGELKQRVVVENLVTDVGDLYYAQRGAGGTPQAPTGMRLGKGTTATSKSGAGAAIVTAIPTTGVRPLDSGFPTAAVKTPGGGSRITWQATWSVGQATTNDISEVALTNEATLTQGAGTQATTLARSMLNPWVNKGANDTLVVTWYHDFLGA